MIINMVGAGGTFSKVPKYTYTGESAFSYLGGNWELVLLTSGSLTFQSRVGSIDLCLVGGGGAGQSGANATTGGVGGAGGYIVTGRNIAVAPKQDYEIHIGEGGTASAGPGGETIAFNHTAAGGSGRAAGTAAGGSGAVYAYYNAGAGGAGQKAFDGEGLTLLTNWDLNYGGGGGGGGTSYAGEGRNGGAGGVSGGGKGGNPTTSSAATAKGGDGAANTGGGGGGGTGAYELRGVGGAGGSGVVILRNARRQA